MSNQSDDPMYHKCPIRFFKFISGIVRGAAEGVLPGITKAVVSIPVFVPGVGDSMVPLSSESCSSLMVYK